MLECLVLGDSIAQGVSTYLPECQKQILKGYYACKIKTSNTNTVKD
jgi:hypothetical protein